MSEEDQPVYNQCPECQEVIDVGNQPPFAKIICPYCNQAIRVRTTLGPFFIDRLLGEGGMSQVFLARDSNLSRAVALKILHAELSQDEILTAQFEREAKLTASINHANVVKVYTVGKDQGYFFIAMELVDGSSLEERIAESGSVNQVEVLDIAYDVTSGLRAAHKEGLIHRDIKPGNILLSSEPAAKLVDFGLAIIQGGQDATEDVWATPYYVPLEKLYGQPEDFRGDIYSLGATLFHALAGKPPFDANTSSIQELIQIKEQPIRLADYTNDVKPAVCALIDRMMAHQPGARHQSYDELLEHIEKVQDSLPGARTRKRGGSGTARTGQDALAPAAKYSLVAAGVLLLAGGGWYWWSQSQDSGGKGLGLDPDTERVLSAGEQDIASEYHEARQALIGRKFQDAERGFAGLLKNEDLKQPTRNWTRFHAGLALLFEGKEPKAREVFRELAQESPEEAGVMEPALAKFFHWAGSQLQEALPVLPEEAGAEAAMEDLPPLAFLAFGLKNWNQNQFESAGAFLTQFREASLEGDFAWMEPYKALTAPYLNDLSIISQAGRPRSSMSPEELTKLANKLETDAAALKTSGAAPSWMKDRAERAVMLASLPRNEKPAAATAASTKPPAVVTPPPPKEKKVTAPDSREAGKFIELMEKVHAQANTFDFDAAALTLKAETFESEVLRDRVRDELTAVTLAGEFLNEVLERLRKQKFEGDIFRRAGHNLKATVNMLEGRELSVDLGFGPSTLKLSDLKATWPLYAAEREFLRDAVSPPAEHPELWARAACYASMININKKAEELADKAGKDNPDFREFWSRLNESYE